MCYNDIFFPILFAVRIMHLSIIQEVVSIYFWNIHSLHIEMKSFSWNGDMTIPVSKLIENFYGSH